MDGFLYDIGLRRERVNKFLKYFKDIERQVGIKFKRYVMKQYITSKN